MRPVNSVKPPETRQAYPPFAPHGRDQRAPAGRQRDAFSITSSTTATGRPFEQRHALAQRRLERDLAAHRPLGDRRHMRFQPGIVGQLVDAFLADHGGIHVGDEQPLAPGGEGLHHDVDRRGRERGAHAFGDRFVVGAVRRKGNVDGDAGIESAASCAPRQRGTRDARSRPRRARAAPDWK